MDESVSKKEFNEFRVEQNDQHKLIDDKLSKLAPLSDPKLIKTLQESAELKLSTDRVVNTLTRRAKVVAIFLGIIAVLLTIYLNLRHIFIDVVIKN